MTHNKFTSILAAFLILIIVACRNDHSQHATEQPVTIDTFTNYLKHFPKAPLPLTLKGCDIDASKLHRLAIGSYAVGKFPTPNGIAVITLEAADCMLPVITTYTHNGKRISSETIAIGYCDDGPCQDCNEYMEIDNDLQFYTSDTILVYPCDDDYNKIDGRATIRIIYKDGFIREDGSIELSDEKRKES